MCQNTFLLRQFVSPKIFAVLSTRMEFNTDFCDDWVQDVVTNYTFSDNISLPEEFLPFVDKQKILFEDIVTNTTYPDALLSNLPLHTAPNFSLLEDNNNVAQQTVDIKTEHKDEGRKREKRRKGSGKAEESPSLDVPINPPLPPPPAQTVYFEVMKVQIARNNGLYHDTSKSQVKIRIDSSLVPKHRWIRGSVEMELLHKRGDNDFVTIESTKRNPFKIDEDGLISVRDFLGSHPMEDILELLRTAYGPNKDVANSFVLRLSFETIPLVLYSNDFKFASKANVIHQVWKI